MPLILILIFSPLSFSAWDKMLINSHLWSLHDSCCLFNLDYKPIGQASFLSSAVLRAPKAGVPVFLCVVTVLLLCQGAVLMVFTKKWTAQVGVLSYFFFILSWKIFYFALGWLDSGFIKNTELDTKPKWSLNAFWIMLVILSQKQLHLSDKVYFNHFQSPE